MQAQAQETQAQAQLLRPTPDVPEGAVLLILFIMTTAQMGLLNTDAWQLKTDSAYGSPLR